MATNFGRDISCLTGIRSGVFASGTRLVAESIYRRLTTKRGALRGGEAEADYGLDLTELVGVSTSRQLQAAMPGRVRNEILKDERVNDATVSYAESQSSNGAISITFQIMCTTDEGPFDLQLRVSEGVTVELLGISP